MTLVARPRVGTASRVVKREHFNQIVSVWAYQRWKSKELERRRRNWYEALRELGADYVWPSSPSHLTVCIRALEVYDRHKDADAFEDWCMTEREAEEYYEVRD